MKILYGTDENDLLLSKRICILLFYLLILTLILIIGRIFDSPYIKYTCYVLALIDIDPFIIVSITNVFIVISNKKKKKSKKLIKYKYAVDVEIETLEKWVKNANLPDRIVIMTNQEKHSIEISFDFDNGIFFDKEIIFDEKIIDENNMIEVLHTFSDVKILWYTENNDPTLFIKMINSH